MSVDIYTIRGEGDIEGPAIIDPLISSEAVAIQAGRNALDGATFRVLRLTTIERTYDGSIRSGMTHQLEDVILGATSIAKVIGVEHIVSKNVDNGAIDVDTKIRVIGEAK